MPETAPAFAALLTGDLDEMRLTFAQKKELDAKAGDGRRSARRHVRRALVLLFRLEQPAAGLLGPPRAARPHDARGPREHQPQPLRGAREARERAASARALGVGCLRSRRGRTTRRRPRRCSTRPASGRARTERGARGTCASPSRSRSAWAATSSARSWSSPSSPSERRGSRWRSSRWSGRLSWRRWTRGSARPGRPR